MELCQSSGRVECISEGRWVQDRRGRWKVRDEEAITAFHIQEGLRAKLRELTYWLR